MIKKALRCRNCIYCIQKENLKYFYYCQVRTYGKYNRNYCVNRSTKACDKFEVCAPKDYIDKLFIQTLNVVKNKIRYESIHRLRTIKEISRDTTA